MINVVRIHLVHNVKIFALTSVICRLNRLYQTLTMRLHHILHLEAYLRLWICILSRLWRIFPKYSPPHRPFC